MAVSDQPASGGPHPTSRRNRAQHVILAWTVACAFTMAVLESACRSGGMTPPAVQVSDGEHGRKLLIHGRLRAYADTGAWESRLKYVAVMNLPRHFFPTPGRMLLIGPGCGSIAKNYSKEHWSVDSAEPDSAVTGVARRSFGLRDEDMKIYQADGREFLASHPDLYTVILEDLVGSREVSSQLLTGEFFQSVRAHLIGGGVFGVSFECAGWHDELVRSIAATLKEHFPSVVVLPIAEPPNRFGSIVIIASTGSVEELAREVDRNADLDPEWRFGPKYQETHAWDNRFVPSTEGMMIQSDAHYALEGLFVTIDDSARAQGEDYTP